MNIPPGYYTVEDLFNLCNFSLIPKSVIEEIPESEEIHPSAEGHYTPIYGNYVYPQFKIGSNNNVYPTMMENGASRYIKVPNGTYTDDTYFWTAEKLIAKRWFEPNLPTTDAFVMHTVTITPETITIEVPEEGTLTKWTCCGETVKFFDYLAKL